MDIIIKFILGFILVWFIWYLTGGPLRDTDNPYVNAPGNVSVPRTEVVPAE